MSEAKKKRLSPYKENVSVFIEEELSNKDNKEGLFSEPIEQSKNDDKDPIPEKISKKLIKFSI